MLWTYVGWILWAALALYSVSLWLTAFRDANGGVRLLASTCASTFTIALVISAVPNFPRLHLLWIALVLYLGSMTIAGKLIDIRLKTAPARAEKQSSQTGEPKEDILRRELENLGYGPGGPES